MFIYLMMPMLCLSQQATIVEKGHGINVHYPWLSLGFSVGRQYNYTHVLNHTTVPSAGTSEFVVAPATNFGLRIQKEFDRYWLWRGGIDISEFGFRLLTTYNGGGWGRSGAFEQHTQVHFSVQNYPLRRSSWRTRPYLRLGVLASVYTGSPTKTSVGFSRQLSGSPTYYDYIDFNKNLWFKPGLLAGIGFSRRIQSGFMFDLVLVAYRGFSTLADIDYRVERDTEAGPPRELLNTKIINRGSFIGFEASIYLPPFRYRKVQRELNKQR